jgi:hypothetical protein
MMNDTVRIFFCSLGRAGVCLLAFWLSALPGLWCGTALAAPVGPDRAHKMVKAWLAKDAKPMSSRLGNQVESVETFTDANGQPVYHVVYLRPNGFVIVPDDNLIEPVVCFSSGGSYDPSGRTPLGALVSRDLPARVNAARVIQKKTSAGQEEGGLAGQKSASRNSTEKALGRWRKLLAEDSNSPGLKTGFASVSDVRVAPLLQTKWGQDVVCGSACFNYYTPPYSAGNSGNYVCGCVATAMAQYMRFWQYPTVGLGTAGYTAYVNGISQTMYLRGGDGAGGAYNWSEMVLVPGCSMTLTQRQAIGALAYDAGVAVGMDFTADGSAASTSDAAAALVGTFGYSNAIFGYNSTNNIGAGLNGMINPNLDWGNPVFLGVDGADGGHEIIADGYGYNGLTLYHHLNMGWDGDYDVWYNLPNIDDAYYPYNVVDETIYNIYISGTGEIISGRVTAAGSGTPISGATVTALKTGGTYQATTNAKGFYAIANVPSNSTYTMSVAKSGYSFTSRTASTGLSQDSHAVSGNLWAIDFTGTLITTPADPIVAVKKCNVAAGRNAHSDTISFSGTMNATADDFNDANVVVTIDSNDMVSPCVPTFPVINGETFKNGKFKCSASNASFAFDTKTSKFSFTAKNVDLSGLSCPLTVRIEIGDYISTTDVNEAIVNGTKPIPINLMMGTKDVLRVDKIKVNKPKSNQLSVTGGFAVEDPAVSMVNRASEGLVVTLGAQQFTVPANKLNAGKDKFTCRNALVAEDGLATADFNFKTCVFTLTIKNTPIMADPNTADFSVEFFGFSE